MDLPFLKTDESPRSAAGQLRTTPEGATGPQAATLEQYLFHTRRFLSERFGKSALSLSELNAQDVVRCILRQARTISPHAARCMGKALRSLLRFLHQRGDISTNLAMSVPSVAKWRLAELPKYLSPQQVELV